MKLTYKDLGQGITCLDTHYQRLGFAGCYLVRQGESAALIDTGTAHTVPLVMELLKQKGIPPEQLKYIIPTHVHLDHAGGVGLLMQHLPDARLVIHPFGARHMIDPAKLQAGAITVYGEETFKQDYIELHPVDETRVLKVEDESSIELDGRVLRFLDTPGHARHHICVWDEQSRGLFTGDTFGLAYRELATENGPFMILPSTPIQFDPDAWHDTLNRLMSYQPQRVYLAHYREVEQPESLVGNLHEALDDFVAIARAAAEQSNREQAIKGELRDYYINRLQRHGCGISNKEIDRLLDMDFSLCAQGLDYWLQHTA